MLIYPERGLVLNEVAAAILELCDGARTVRDIAQTLAIRSRATPEAVEADVVSFLETMKDKGLLALVTP